MTQPPEPPGPKPDGPRPDGPEPGEPGPAADMREAFSRTGPSDPDAGRAFLESRLEMIRTHPTLTPAEKDAAVAEALERFHRPAPES